MRDCPVDGSKASGWVPHGTWIKDEDVKDFAFGKKVHCGCCDIERVIAQVSIDE